MEVATAGQAPAGVIPGAGGSEGAPGAEPGQEENAPDPAQVEADLAAWREATDSRLDGALDGIRQVATLMQQRLPEPQAEPQPNFEDQFNQLLEAGNGVIEPQQLQGLIQSQVQSGIEQGLAPIQAQLAGFQQQMTAQELQGLQSQFPELADQKAADQLADNVVNEIVGLGVPEQFAEGLMHNAKFVRMVHLAKKAETSAQGETLAGQGPIPQIETGGGAAPSSAGGDEWDAIAKSGRPAGPSLW